MKLFAVILFIQNIAENAKRTFPQFSKEIQMHHCFS